MADAPNREKGGMELVEEPTLSAAELLEGVIEQGEHQAKHNAPVSTDLLNQLRAILKML